MYGRNHEAEEGHEMTDMKVPMPTAPCAECVENTAAVLMDDGKIKGVIVYCEHNQCGGLLMPVSAGIWRTYSRITFREFTDYLGTFGEQLKQAAGVGGPPRYH
jgi:pyruvate kinase